MTNPAEIAQWRAEAALLHHAGQLDAAAQLYRRILARDAADPDARHMLAVLYLQQGRVAEALEMLDRLAAEVPDSPEVRTHHALALRDLGRHDEALADFDQALALKRGHALTLLYRGNLLLALGRNGEALESYDQLVATSPGDAEAWFRRGNALWQLEQPEAAAASFETAHRAEPAHFGALFNLATVLMRLERYGEAFAAYRKARALRPDHPYLLGSEAGAVLGGCDLARWDEYRALVTQALTDRSAVIAPLTALAFCDDAGLHRAAAEMFVAAEVPQPPPPLWTGVPRTRPRPRIRIAYLSADFRYHATADLIAGLIARHDRARFEVAAISFGRDDASAMRARLVRAFERFIDVRDRSDAQAAMLLRDLEIDIAIDLKGHTDDARPAILSHRPCPVQVQYLGYPGTMAAPWIDYILADRTVLQPDLQPFYNEQIIHLPHCYQVNDSTRAIAATPSRAAAGLPDGAFVFCCFNAAWKISPPLFDLWMRLLHATSGSVLWLLDDNETAVRNLKAAAQSRGIDPARVVFAPRAPSDQHLARHRLADLFLDTVPYNAHTTASDALWAGLPLLTIAGNTFSARVAASLLTAIGMPELVTHNLADYESLALELARDPARLTILREKLDRNRLTSPLFDTDLFRRHIEAAYQHMIATARRGEPARGFAIPA